MNQALHEDIRKVLDRQGTTGPSFDFIACMVTESFDAQSAVIYTLDSGTGMLKLRCHRGLEKSAAKKVEFLCMGKGLPGQAAVSRQPLQGYHLSEGGCASPASDLFATGSLFVPMVHEGGLRGVLGIGKGFHHQYAPDQVAALSAVAHLIAAYLK